MPTNGRSASSGSPPAVSRWAKRCATSRACSPACRPIAAPPRCSARPTVSSPRPGSKVMEQRVLILAPFGRDADVIAEVLHKDQRACVAFRDADALSDALDAGAGAALIAEEALADEHASRLFTWLEKQPAWSDFPFILLAASRVRQRSERGLEVLERLGNVVVLERPLNSETLRRAVASSLRARARQYESRRHLAERIEAQQALVQLNDSLESRIAARTHELASANNRLMMEIHERAKVQAVLVQSQKMEALG